MKPRVGVFSLSGCWGEQMVILNCEDQLLDLAGLIDLVDFSAASSRNDVDGPLDIAFVEGSVGNAAEEQKARRIRERAALVVACGSCACFGGISAMTGDRPREEVIALVYGPAPPPYDYGPHRPLGAVIPVDLHIPGCPMEADEFLRAVGSLVNGDRPLAPGYPVCTECKMNEQDCLLLARRLPCAGPITQAGCKARCPAHNVPCIGCRGPVDEANVASLARIWADAGFSDESIRRRLATFASLAPDRAAPSPEPPALQHTAPPTAGPAPAAEPTRGAPTIATPATPAVPASPGARP